MSTPTLHSKILPLAVIGVGAGLWTWGANQLTQADEQAFEFTPNIGAVHGSPFGKTLAIAAQGSIGFYWHEGKDDPTAAHVHGPECADGCTHEAHDESEHVHGPDCDHGDDHDHSAHEHGPDCAEGCGHDHDSHEHGPECDEGCTHGTHDDSEPIESPSPEPNAKPLMARAKVKLEKLSAATFKKSNDEPMSPRHKRYLSAEIEKKLEFAHKLDPLNYTNFNNLFLFYSTNEFGTGLKTVPELHALATRTRSLIDEQSENPEPWLTAAATQDICFDLLYNWQPETRSRETLEAHLADYRHCLISFKEKAETLQAAGVWENISQKRRDQMMERFLFLSKLYKAKQSTLEQWVPNTPAVSASH